jgi:periplasmic divalent cation tolerance protein
VAEFLQVVTTLERQQDADRIARSAVESRLAACAQVVGPVSSTYWWDGAVQVAQEWQVLFKTAAERYPALAQHLAAIHPYDEPEIVATEIVAGSDSYLGWLREQTRGL